MSSLDKAEAIRRDDEWLLSRAFIVKDSNDPIAFIQSFCNVLPERPLIKRIEETEPLINTRGNKIKTYRVEMPTGQFRAVKMAEGMVLTPFEDVDISTAQGRSSFLETAQICIPFDVDYVLEHIGYIEHAATAGMEMLRETSKPKPIHFHARFTHPSMGLGEPDGYCFLFRLEDQSQLFLTISDDGALLTATEPPFEILATRSITETEKALADFQARNREHFPWVK